MALRERPVSSDAHGVEAYGIVGRGGNLSAVAEGSGTVPGEHGTKMGRGEEGHGAIVLCASAHNPVRIAETLKEGILIIIGCAALELGVGRLRCPEVHSVRLKHSGYHLPVLLAALTKASGCLHGAGGGAYSSVNVRKQCHVLVAAE